MSYVRNAWYVAAWSHDLTRDQPAGVSILCEPIALWRADGRVIAFEDRCAHRLAPLSLGRCEGASLRCMYHGLRYSPDGKCIEVPGQERVPAGFRVRTYAAVERHSWIWVWMGDPGAADESLIPAAVGLDDPDYILGSGQLDYEAEARLINDNLLDFSHLTYVHAASFQAGPAFAEERPAIEALPRGVRISRWVTGSPSGRSGARDGALVDRYSTYDFLIPGVLLMTGGEFEPGSAAHCRFRRPDLADATGGVTFTSQAVTPTAAKTSRYFFSWGPHRRCGGEALCDQLMALARQAFAEDKTMIEAQQRILDATAEPVIRPTAHDRALIMYNRLVEQLAEK
jgi:vanillate O-demethylase monooxygenase subunit